MRLILSCFLLSCSALPAIFAQSVFLEDGQNGAVFAAGYASNREAYSLVGTVGFSMKGRLDLRLSAGPSALRKNSSSGFTFSPTFEYHVLRISDGSASFGLQLESASFSYNENPTHSITSASAFFGVTRESILTEYVMFYLSYKPHRVWSRLRAPGGFREIRFWAHSLALAGVVQLDDKLRLVLGPTILISNSIPVWAGEIGVVY